MDEWTTRKEYLRLTLEEEEALRMLYPLMERNVDQLVESFYRHLLTFQETRQLLSDDLISTRLKAAQKQYLLSLVTGPYDDRYRTGRVNIGHVHERIGLTPQWYLGAYALYLNLLHPLIFEEFQHKLEQCQFLRIALTKVVFLDIGLAIEAYIGKANEKIEFANRELAAMAKELGRGLDQRTQELARSQEQLRQTEQLAELGTLASGMAHEIGTPMNVILGRAEHLMQRTEDEKTKKGLETIIAQVERITKIMNQLLSIARRKPTERGPVNLQKTIADTLDVVQERLQRHSIHVETNLETTPLVFANPDQMNQILLNMVINAIQAMPEGGTLRLGLGPAGDQVRLSIADTGSGIPQEDLDKIFEPFYTTKEPGKGTGLGLAVVKGIVEEHRGWITVESTVGHGTTFLLTLPVVSGSQ